jgi:opacity protein-like surface antigen
MKSIKIVLSIVAVCIAATSVAQQKGQSFIGINGGISFPLDNWGKSATVVSINGTVTDPDGYANTGGFGALDGAYFFSKHFGIGGLLSYGTYSLKNVAALSQGYQESFDVDTTRTTPTNYTQFNFLPGIYFNSAIAKKLSFTARALAGISSATTPKITVSIEDGGVFDPPLVQESASKSAFAFDLGAGLSYALKKCLALNLNADYFYTKPDFTIDNTARNNNAGREITEYNQPLDAVNISLGIAYLFCKK